MWRTLCVTWFIVCAVEYEERAVLCNAPFSYCKLDACKLNDDRTNNTESTCKFTAGNAQYWTHNGNVRFQFFAAVVAEMIIAWVIVRCGIISFPRYFARTFCHYIQGDWIRFRWMLKWLEEAKWGRYTISPLFPLRSNDWLHSLRPSICICRQASNIWPVVLAKTSGSAWILYPSLHEDGDSMFLRNVGTGLITPCNTTVVWRRFSCWLFSTLSHSPRRMNQNVVVLGLLRLTPRGMAWLAESGNLTSVAW